jgi:hypothetical protein
MHLIKILEIESAGLLDLIEDNLAFLGERVIHDFAGRPILRMGLVSRTGLDLIGTVTA